MFKDLLGDWKFTITYHYLDMSLDGEVIKYELPWGSGVIFDDAVDNGRYITFQESEAYFAEDPARGEYPRHYERFEDIINRMAGGSGTFREKIICQADFYQPATGSHIRQTGRKPIAHWMKLLLTGKEG